MIDVEEDYTGVGGNQDNTNLPFSYDPSLRFTITDRAMIDLIICCNKAGTPIKFLDEILLILKRHVRKGFDIEKAPKRSSFMEQLRQRIPCPKSNMVISPSGVLIPKFSFLD